MFIKTLFFMSWFARYSQLVSSFGSTTSQDFSSISRSHSVHKSVLISSFSFRWLKRSFAHCFVSLKMYLNIFDCFEFRYFKTECKYTKTFISSKWFYNFFFNSFSYLCHIKITHLCFIKLSNSLLPDLLSLQAFGNLPKAISATESS